jgi:trehalose/maltose hydrolase-like predicted phosphorylase
LNLPFNAWQETISGGCPHFITGAGGFLQGLWAGFGGVRILNDRVVFNPVLPEYTTYLKYRQVRTPSSRLALSLSLLNTRADLRAAHDMCIISSTTWEARSTLRSTAR